MLATAASTTAAPTGGPARVIDGDTVVVASTRVHLKGVDDAELGTARRECPARDGHDDRYAPFEEAAALAAQPRSPYCKRS